MKLNIDKYNDYFQQQHSESFELRKGKGYVLVSAPHSVEQTREGVSKFAEPQTGILALMLHDELDCPVIFKTKNCNDDANYDEVSPYKDAVINYIKNNGIRLLIDLHQLSYKRTVNVDFGVANFKNIDNLDCLNILLEEFSNQNLGIIQIDLPFDASYPYTVSSYVRNNSGIQSIQIELNSKLLYGALAEEYFEKVYVVLRNAVIKLNTVLGDKDEK